MLRIDESMKMSLLLFAGIALCQSASVPATMTVVPEEARCCATDTPATPTPVARVRLSWEDFVKGPDGAKRLASLEKGIAKMKSLDAQRGSTDPQKQLDYKRSWEYWANIHGYYGTGPNSSGNVEAMKRKYPAAAASWNGIPDQTPPSDGVAPKVWGTCVHSDPPTVDADGNQIYHESPFWGWHRIYLYYFERVLRWASGDDTLNLPYWDYTNPTYAVLPAQFQTTSAVLYADKRSVKINHGGKISSTNVDDALKQSVFTDAEGSVEWGVHGTIHCAVGGGCPVALMGDVPVAGNDPIFYMHHANIDRLWACWDHLHSASTATGAGDNTSYSFPDETGTLQTRKVSEFLSTDANGYVYENVANCLRKPAAHVVHTAAVKPQTQKSENPNQSVPLVVGSAAGVKLTEPRTTVDIAVPRQMLTALAKPTGPITTRLVLRDITAQVAPGAMVDVFVEAKGKPNQRKYVGTINWFGAFGHHHEGPSVQARSFDITDQLKTLGVTADGITVTMEATTGVTAPPPSGIAPQTATSQPTGAINPDSHLTIGLVEIRQVPIKQ